MTEIEAKWTFTGAISIEHPDLIHVKKGEKVILPLHGDRLKCSFQELADRGYVEEIRPKPPKKKGRPKVQAKVIRPKEDKSVDKKADKEEDRPPKPSEIMKMPKAKRDKIMAAATQKAVEGGLYAEDK